MFRMGLKELLEKNDEYSIVAQAQDGEELLRQVDEHLPDLVITDLSMPKMTGIEALIRIKEKYADIKVMVLSMHKDRHFFRKVISFDVDGFVLKNEIYEELLSGIRTIRQGRRFFSKELTTDIIEDYQVIRDSELSLDLLTKREKQVLVLLADGMRNLEIAQKLNLSVRTVEAHRGHLMEKLDIDSVQGLTKFAIEKGLI